MWRACRFPKIFSPSRPDGGLWIAAARLGLLFGLVLSVLNYDVPRADNRAVALDRVLAGKQFDLAGWMIAAGAQKIGHELTLPQLGMTDEAQVAFARDFVRRVGDFQRAEAEVNAVFTDPSVKDPQAATRELRAERDRLRADVEARRNTFEAIIQDQIEAELRAEGFALGGQVVPPLRFRLTELPDVLIISRRDRIERIDQRELTTGLTVDGIDQIERDVDRRFDVSSLVTPIGGLGAYPTMLPETTSLGFIVRTAAHEWLHNYLLFNLASVAVNYEKDPAARAINETTAVIVEREIGERVLGRFYPEAKAAAFESDIAASVQAETAPTAFDFRKEMRETRLRADDLLAQGQIDEAERYMEDRRALFVKNGYLIRKLNQAYFAFYGAYNAEPGGAPAAGRDPIGPAVQTLRKRSASIGDFVREVASVTGLQDLRQRIGEAP